MSALLRWRHFRLSLSLDLPLSLSLSVSLCISLSHRAHLTHKIGNATALSIISAYSASHIRTNQRLCSAETVQGFSKYIIKSTLEQDWGMQRLIYSLWARVHKNKSMQRLISSQWGIGKAKFQVTWLLRNVQKGVSMWQCCVVYRWLMSMQNLNSFIALFLSSFCFTKTHREGA